MKKRIVLFLAAIAMALVGNAQLKHGGNILLATLGETENDTLLSKLVAKVGDRSKEVGAELQFDGGRLTSFTFYNVPMEGYNVYDDTWPFGLDSSKSKGFLVFAISEPGTPMPEGDVLQFEVPGVDIELTFRGGLLAKGTFSWDEAYRNAGKSVSKEEIDDFLSKKAKGRIYSKRGSCVEGDCENGSGKMEMKNGLQYEGEWKHYFAHGNGRIDLPKGGYYDGEFALGYPHGVGEQKGSSGRVWKGGFKMGDRHGEGTLVIPDGTEMAGSYEEGTMQDEWVITYPGGQTRTVTYKDGKMIR